jgi:hypothetical protein
MQTIPGAPHKEGTQRATPNRLEASFKSNKCESKNPEMLQVLLRRGESMRLSKLMHTSLGITSLLKL